MFELKGLKQFKGHEGEPLMQSNIYFNGKKVGSWSDDSWGGEMRIIFENKDIQDKFVEFSKDILKATLDYEGNPYNVATMDTHDIMSSALYEISTKEAQMAEIKKLTKTAIVFYVKDSNSFNGKSLYTWKVPYSAKNVAIIKSKHPNLLEICNETLKMPLIDENSDAFKLSEKNKMYKKTCKNKTLFIIKDATGSLKEMIIKAVYSKAVVDFIKDKYPNNLVEIVNERYL